MKLQELNENNYKDLAALFCEMWPNECAIETEISGCFEIMNNNQETAYLYDDAGQYVAFIYIKIRSDFVEGSDSERTPYVEGIYLREAYRRKGYGEKLVKKAESWARNNGFSQLASDVEIENDVSLEFHHKIGFKEVNRVVCLIKNISKI